MSIALRPDRPNANGRRTYPRDVRELAYQHWAFIVDRSPKAAAIQVASEWDAGWGTPPTFPAFAQTVAEWAQNERWAERARADLARIAPDLEGRIVTELMFAAYAGARLLRRVAESDEVIPDSRTRVIAATNALDRFGFDPKTVGDRVMRVTTDTGQRISSAALLDLSPAQLAERLAQLRDEPIDVPGDDVDES